MGGTQSSELTAEDKAKWEAKNAQVSLLKAQLIAKVEEHNERLNSTVDETEGDRNLKVFKDELMATVSEHTRTMADMEAEQEQLRKFKSELLDKANEHLDELHKAEDKAKIVATFKDEMLAKVDAHVAAMGN